MENKYLHGYSDLEQQRLIQQADILSEYIYPNFDFSNVTTVLELGCGSGGQTQQLLKRHPHLQIISVDISPEQIEQAKRNFEAFPAWQNQVTFYCGSLDTMNLNEKVDAVFICWVLEHVNDPLALLQQARNVIKPGGKIFITEVYNRSFDYAPRISSFDYYFQQYNQLQLDLGGNPHIGPLIGSLLVDAGYVNNKVLPSINFHDKSTPESRKFMFEYWFDLMLSAKNQLRNNQYVSQEECAHFEQEYAHIYKDPNAYFYYCAFQLVAEV